MSFLIGGAILVSTLAGGKASKDASKANSKGIQKGLNQSAEIAKQSRADVMSLFDISAKKANIGLAQSLDFYKQNAQKRMQPFIQGNQSAQNVIGLGAQQANNAILGLPVDMSFTNQPQVQADYGGIMGAQLPEMGQSFADKEQQQIAAQEAATAAAAPGIAAATQQQAANEAKKQDSLSYRLNPKNALNNVKNDVKKVKRTLGKIF